jgi:hypothetical protein
MNASTSPSLLQAAGFLAALVILALPAAAQDTIGDGFAQTARQPIPVAFASYDTLSSGERVVFDGLAIDLYDAAGGFAMNLATMPAFVFNSFVEVDPSDSFALVGESSNGDIFRVALDGSGMVLVANLNFNFDAVFESANTAIISAATCGFGCGNDVARLDVTTGVVTFLASVSGASGPVAMAGDGSIFYATVDPTNPSNTNILYWTSGQLPGGGSGGGPILSESDATVFHAGLEGAASLAIDPVFGNVFLAESVWASTSRILEFDIATGNLADVVVRSSSWLSNIELMQGDTVGHFHGYQPEDGVFMHYSNGDIVTVRPQHPTATHTQVGPVVTIGIEGAKPNSALLMVFGPQVAYDPDYQSYQLNFDFQFQSALPITEVHRTPLLLPTDASGNGSFQYFDPGHLAGNYVFQALMTDETGKFIGGTQAALN